MVILESILNFSISNLLSTMAGVIMLISFIAKDVLWLRSFLFCAFLLNAMAGIMLGMYTLIIWDVAFCLIHAYHIAVLMIERNPMLLPHELKPYYEHVFNHMSPGEFMKLWKIGELAELNDEMVVRDGEVPEDLLFILDGHMAIEKNGKKLTDLESGFFVGEMSFLSGNSASTDVKAVGPVQCHAWSRTRLAKLKTNQPQLYNKLIAIIGLDLVQKIQLQNQRA